MKYVFMLLFVFFSNLSWAQNKVDVLVLYPDTVANVLGNNVAVQAANFINQQQLQQLWQLRSTR